MHKLFKINFHLTEFNFLLVLIVTLLFLSCTKNKNTKPSIETIGYSNLTSTSVIINGKINNSDNSIQWQGVVWGTTSNPEVEGLFQTEENVSLTSFNSQVYNLLPNTTYHFRTYLNLGNIYNIVYGNEITITTPPSETSQFNINKSYGSVTDIDGNQYKTIQIGNQTWMAENLKVNKFNNGLPISEVTINSSFYNNGNPAWCYYKDSVQYNNTFGKLYNEFVVTNSNNVCPSGWHIPTFTDFETMRNSLPTINNNGGILKATGYNFWKSPNSGANNETGFSAVGGGIRENLNYYGGKEISQFWVQNNYFFVLGYIGYGEPVLMQDCYLDNLGTSNAGEGYSIRCVKD